MATKTVKKEILPRIYKKWYDFKIDSKTLKPVEFSWSLSSGIKRVRLYDSTSKPNEEVMRLNLRNKAESYYFVFDRTNRRIFAYPVMMSGHDTRSSCETAHYEKINDNVFYMFDENKQIWEIPKSDYRKYTGYNYQTHEYTYTMIEAKPRKVSRMSTYHYNMQCQLTAHIKAMFSELYGHDFVYQNKLVMDKDIRDNHWIWIAWLQAKGRRYSDKTIKNTDELMNKISPDSRTKQTMTTGGSWYTGVVLESVEDTAVLCYYSNCKETFRQIFNPKTCKVDHFIWKNDKWQKSSKLSDWQNINKIEIADSYRKTNPYDYQFLFEAEQHFHNRSDQDKRRYWYSPEKCLYNMLVNYLGHPVIHQILQIQTNDNNRKKLYNESCDLSKLYGKIPNKGKTLFAKLGVNKYQFANPSVIVYMKWLLETQNISHIDNDTWDRATEAFMGLGTGNYQDNEMKSFLKSRGEFSIDRWINICKLEKFDRAQHSGNYYYTGGVKQLYSDYYKSLSAMAEFGIDISSYPLIFNVKEQLQRYHDDAARAVSAVKNRAQDEKFEMLYYKREKMLENDGTHMITMPKCSSDLVEEGSYLHHCVGGYVNSVANGNTAIYFLRQSSAPDTPWLTVEVANKQCRQIHGSCNAWMGSKDEYFDAVPFLVWWFDKHDIQYSENLLTNMATGYGSISQRRTMPTAKIEAYKASKKNKK